MSHPRSLIAVCLLAVTLVAVGYSAINAPASIVADHAVELVVYSVLTSLALLLAIPAMGGELSIAHAMGMISFLSLAAGVAYPMTVAIFLGGIVGEIIVWRFTRRGDDIRSSWGLVQEIAFTTAQVTLPFFVAGRIYVDIFQAPQPLSPFIAGDPAFSTPIPLLVYTFLYVVLYFSIFVLQRATHPQYSRLLNGNLLSLLVTMLLPVPFAVIAAIVARRDTSLILFSIVIIGAILVMLGLYTFNQVQNRLRRQLNELRSISVATQAMRGSLDLVSLLRITYVQVSQLLNVRNFMIALYDINDPRLRFPFVIRDGEEKNWDTETAPDDLGLVLHIMRQREPLLIASDVATYTNQHSLPTPGANVHSWLGIPLISKEKQALGAVIVRSHDEQRFDENDLRLLNIIATSASIALENASLYQQKSLRTERLSTLNQVTTLLTGTLAPNEVLDTIVSSASTISEANAVAVYLTSLENNRPELQLMRSAGLSNKFEIEGPPPLISGDAAYSDVDALKPKALVINNIHTDDRYSRQHPIHRHMLAEGKQALIEILMAIKGRRLGVLALYFDDIQHFQDEEIDLIQAFSIQAAQAIDNAYTFTSTDQALEQRVEQLYALAALGRLLNATMDTDRIFQIVLTYVTDATSAPNGLIAIQPPGGNMRIVADKHYPAAILENTAILQHGLTGRVMQTGQPLRVVDIRRETGYKPLLPLTQSMLIVPIMNRRNMSGVIVLEHPQAGYFSEDDMHFVAQLANQAVIAIDNTQLFQSVRAARDNLQTILNAMEDGIILIDIQGKVVLANPRVDLIGLDAGSVLDRPVRELLQTENLAFAQRLGFYRPDALLNLLSELSTTDVGWTNQAVSHYEISTVRYGVHYIQRQIIPVFSDAQKVIGVLFVLYNKTEEHELALQRESFSQMIVHDLRSPLTAVTTSLRLLQELVPDESDFRPIVEKTTEASRRAIRKVLTRVDSLLDISKMESGQMSLEREPADLVSLAESVLNELRPLAVELDVTMINAVSPDLPPLDVDGDKIERMLLNLVDNALKYSPATATVIVEGQLENVDYLRVAVIDNGPGIPDEYKERLFNRFVQVEGRAVVRRGVGLGLAFCKLVTEAHGGKLWVEDNPDGGSIFLATLPIAKFPELIE